MNRASAIVGSVLGIVSVTIGIILGVRQLIPDPEPSRHSVLLLVDTSRSMNQPFGRRMTKLESVHAQVRRYVKRRPDWAIGLRFTGGACSDAYAEPSVAFGENNTPAIVSALQRHTTASGRSDLGGGLSQAVNDFDRFEAGRSADVQLIWAFLGSGDDQCTSDVYEEIETALEGFERPVKFDFFGLRASGPQQRRLLALADRLRRDDYEVQVKLPDSSPQLQKDIEETVLRETPSP